MEAQKISEFFHVKRSKSPRIHINEQKVSIEPNKFQKHKSSKIDRQGQHIRLCEVLRG